MQKLPLFIIAISLALTGCISEARREERLARTYCSSCHQFPEPSLLDKKTWKDKVLPEMAFRMGVVPSQLFNLPESDYPFVLKTLPPSPMVSPSEWEAIVKYFEREAPDSLLVNPPAPTAHLNQFTAEAITLPGTNRFPLFSLLQADSLNKKIFTSNRSSWLHQWDYSFRPIDSIQLSSPVSSISLAPELVLASMGIMDPNDQPQGSLLKLQNGKTELLIDSLKRPVFVVATDFNKDNRTDYVVCNFGNYGGDLVVLENQGNKKYKRHVLSPLPGARKVIVRDFNNDGLPDVLALLTQGDEQISLFTNGGNFRFKINTLLRFPSVYGSSYFEVVDFNQDGHFDILYANGDNADYSTILKPYHGVRIFLNDGKNQFSESWFHSMPGCSWAVARDFDADGDVDIAALSFFPDFTRAPEQSFIYFENQDGKLTPYTTPLAKQGRWLVMETLDIDQDNDEDILLGALNFNDGVPAPIVESWKANPVSILLLRNNKN
ncbi:MAG: VCBS repeat-containing protein [Cyclobacteriaceae bacterium]|nr:VCBS repeat-containing protein [Cyclobacteriaceae bacterium]